MYQLAGIFSEARWKEREFPLKDSRSMEGRAFVGLFCFWDFCWGVGSEAASTLR